MKKSDISLGIISIVFGGLILIATRKMDSTVATFPNISAYLLIILGLLLTGNIFINSRRAAEIEAEARNSINLKSYVKVCSILLILMFYIFLLEKLGFIIPTFILMGCIIYTSGYRKAKYNIATSLGVTIALYLIFTFLFQVNFPKGIFF